MISNVIGVIPVSSGCNHKGNDIKRERLYWSLLAAITKVMISNVIGVIPVSSGCNHKSNDINVIGVLPGLFWLQSQK